jgi:hypothetical protein
LPNVSLSCCVTSLTVDSACGLLNGADLPAIIAEQGWRVLEAAAEPARIDCDDAHALTWLNLVSSGCVLDGVDGGSGVVVQACAGVEDVVAGLDGDAAVAAQGLHEFLIDQPVWRSSQWLTARAAITMVRWASMESRLWW